ncbi:MAG: Tfp pilus assembly protein PilF [Planctomycetota bacterium]|jgi:Tfp pilus assembly protein PilF
MFITVPQRILILAALIVFGLTACGGTKPDDEPSNRELARASALYQEALKALDEGSNIEAMSLLNEGLEHNPDSEELHQTRSLFGERVSHFEEVIASTEWLLERTPGDAVLIGRIVRAGLNGGFLDISRQALNRLKRVDPGSAQTEILAARVYLESGELKAAEEHATRSVELIPEQTTAHHVIGLAREFAGDSELAIESFRRVIFVDPGHLGARDHLATLLLRLERRKESRKHRKIHSTLIQAMPGGYRHFKPSTRIESFTGVVEILPEWYFGFMELGRALMQDEKFEESKEQLDHALTLEARSAELHELMASLLRRTGDIPGAERHAKLAGTPWAKGAAQ